MDSSSVLLVIIAAVLGVAATGFWNDKRRAEVAREKDSELIGSMRERIAALEAKVDVLLAKR